MPKVFVSDAVHQDRLIFDPPQPAAGQGLAPWSALSALYQASFAACGVRVEAVVRPEIYQTDWARGARRVEPGDWHLAVKPIEHLRPFHGIPNVFVCDWPYPELSQAPLGDSPFFDQVRVLKMADAVLCCTAFTAETLRAAGIERVTTLPPHIPAPNGSVIVPSGRGEHCRFLCLADRHRLPRQLGPLIEGFAQAAAQHGRLHLIIDLRDGDEHAASDLRRRVAQTSPALGGTVSVMAGDAGAGLAGTADFFLCDLPASGLHLPLVEAMLAGVPLVTTLNAGTATIVPPGAAFPIATAHQVGGEEHEPIARWLPLTANAPTAAGMCDAILTAASADQAARQRMAASARAAAESRFGLEAFRAGLARLAGFIPLPMS